MGSENRPLDPEWLEDFLALTESDNFSRAAHEQEIMSLRLAATKSR